jgi:hypothetical protein
MLTVAQEVARSADGELSDIDKQKISKHVSLVFKAFHSDDGIGYQELDSIENEDLYTEDDVVEVFIRANSGGTKLGKSDLLFSLLAASWDVADEQMNELLDVLNKHGFAFDRDFVLKTCLVLVGQGARYEVEKFRKKGVRESIEKHWGNIAGAIQDVLDFIRNKTFIQCDKALPSYLVLIPLIYLRYHFPEAWKRAKDVDTYLLRASLAGAFSGQPDNLIDAMVRSIEELKEFSLEELFGVIRSQGRSLELTEERFWQMGYGSEMVHLLFNLWYRDYNYTPAYENNLPQVDHIFPQSALKRVKIENPRTGRKDLIKYREPERNQLANCMLLSREENGAGGKWDTMPEDWFKGKGSGYLKRHLVPSDPDLWKMDRFDDFIAERKKLIRERFAGLFVTSNLSVARNSQEQLLVREP